MINQEMYVSQEISNLESMLAQANKLRAYVLEATEQLNGAYVGLINTKEEFEKIKKANIDEVRGYKYAVVTECKEVSAGIKNMLAAATAADVARLEQFAGICERLNALHADGFFARNQIGVSL